MRIEHKPYRIGTSLMIPIPMFIKHIERIIEYFETRQEPSAIDFDFGLKEVDLDFIEESFAKGLFNIIKEKSCI